MNTIKVNTDIKCTGCLDKVSPVLNEKQAITTWEVDLMDPNKPLTAQVDGMSEEELIAIIQQTGFNAVSA